MGRRVRGLRESGLFLIVPVIDKVAEFVDQRIRVTDVSAETTLTADTVPVNVDAREGVSARASQAEEPFVELEPDG